MAAYRDYRTGKFTREHTPYPVAERPRDPETGRFRSDPEPKPSTDWVLIGFYTYCGLAIALLALACAVMAS